MYKHLFKKSLFYFSFLFLTFSCENPEEGSSGIIPAKREGNGWKVSNLHAPGKFIYSRKGPKGKPANEIPSFVKFSLITNQIADGNDWHIAFRGLEIAVNGGSTPKEETKDKEGNNLIRTGSVEIATVKQAFDDLKSINLSQIVFKKDEANGFAIKSSMRDLENAWYQYDSGSEQVRKHITEPKKKQVFIIKTVEGYYKIEIQSIYQNETPNDPISPTNLDYYSFRYQYTTESEGKINF